MAKKESLRAQGLWDEANDRPLKKWKPKLGPEELAYMEKLRAEIEPKIKAARYVREQWEKL